MLDSFSQEKLIVQEAPQDGHKKKADPFSKPSIYCFLNHSAERRQFRLLCLAALLE